MPGPDPQLLVLTVLFFSEFSGEAFLYKHSYSVSMENLKTLKDLNTKRIFFPALKLSTNDELVETAELRQEAVKWVKALEIQIALQKTTPIIKKLMDETMGVKEMKEGAIEFIIGFFNLTEEELK